MAQSANTIDQETLENVFGIPPVAGQATADNANNGTLFDTDMNHINDSDDNYKPASADYDKFDWTLTKVSINVTFRTHL